MLSSTIFNVFFCKLLENDNFRKNFILESIGRDRELQVKNLQKTQAIREPCMVGAWENYLREKKESRQKIAVYVSIAQTFSKKKFNSPKIYLVASGIMIWVLKWSVDEKFYDHNDFFSYLDLCHFRISDCSRSNEIIVSEKTYTIRILDLIPFLAHTSYFFRWLFSLRSKSSNF